MMESDKRSNSFAELIRNRRTIRSFTEEKLEAEEVELIMRAALLSPTSRNCRAWKFILVEEKTMLRQLSLSKKATAACLEHCALAIVVLSDPVRSAAPVEDTSIAATFIQLQAEDLGLGSCWCQIARRETPDGGDSEQYVRDLLNIPFHYGVPCVIGIGHKKQDREPHGEDHLLWENVYIEQFTENEPL
jgi:nitroreductase